MQKVWRKYAESMEKVWRKYGEGVKKAKKRCYFPSRTGELHPRNRRALDNEGESWLVQKRLRIFPHCLPTRKGFAKDDSPTP